MCSFLGCGLDFSLSLLPAMITLLEPEIATLLSGVTLLHGLGERLEDWGSNGCGRELPKGRGLSGGADLTSEVIDFTLLRLILFSGEND